VSDESTSNGLKLDLIPENPIYKQGDFPRINAIITNISGKEILFSTYLLKHRLLSTLKGGEYEMRPFAPTPDAPPANGDFKALKPGEKLTTLLDPSGEPDYHFLYGGHLPATVTDSMALKGFPAGSYAFNAHLGGYVSFYNAPRGTYNHGKTRKHIVKEMSKPGVTIDLSNAWDGDVIGTCQITFT
jgi:hypothetical protein